MQRFKNILVICDGQELDTPLKERALRLAQSNQAAITLCEVLEAPPGELASLFNALPGVRSHDLELQLLENVRERLRFLSEPFRQAGVVVKETVLQGIGFIEIVRLVQRDCHDLVMKSAAGTQEGRSVFFASADLHLMRKCPCPVWIMKRGSNLPIGKIIAAVDPQPQNPVRYDLNRLVVQLASSLAEIDSSRLCVVHAWRLPEEETLRHSAFTRVPREQVEQLISAQEKDAEGRLRVLLGNFPRIDWDSQARLVKGKATVVIPQIAEEEGAELIVMGTVGRTGVSGLIIGNTAEAILNQVSCSVLAVKPPGFVTPIGLDSH